MKRFIIALALVLLASSLYTSSKWAKKGVNVKDNIL